MIGLGLLSSIPQNKSLVLLAVALPFRADGLVCCLDLSVSLVHPLGDQLLELWVFRQNVALNCAVEVTVVKLAVAEVLFLSCSGNGGPVFFTQRVFVDEWFQVLKDVLLNRQ